MTAYVCNACGNKTRFDLFESKRVRSFHHYTLGGDLSVEEEEVLERSLDKIVCRWCQSTDISERPAVEMAEE
jgi:hypothetical protein